MQVKENLSLDEAIDKLSKSVYLESPDIWIDLTDKINDHVFDEMVLFFATKYDVLPVLKYAVENKFIDLNLPSKNTTYKNIGEHLMSVAIQSNNIDIHNYLKKLLDQDNDEILIEEVQIENQENNNASYRPEFICPSCNVNIFEFGYKASEDIVYKFSLEKNKLVETSRNLLDKTVCCNCNNIIKDISINQLQSICTVQNCSKCSADLTSVGIIDKSKMVYDKESNKFNSTSTSFHCGNCNNEVNKTQIEYFGL